MYVRVCFLLCLFASIVVYSLIRWLDVELLVRERKARLLTLALLAMIASVCLAVAVVAYVKEFFCLSIYLVVIR